MIRLSANLSKKIPVPNAQFSSQQFGASLEVEVSDADQPEALRERIRKLYRLLSEAVDEQVQAAAKVPLPAPAPNGNGGNGNGKQQTPSTPTAPRRPTNATAAQQRAIGVISKRLSLELPALLADYNVADVSQLSVREASKLIDELKKRQATRQ
jgi:hypothetical protein